MHLITASYITHQLSVWFEGRSILKIETIHHKALKVVFGNYVDYDEFFQMTKDVSTPQKHVLGLICEDFKRLNNLS